MAIGEIGAGLGGAIGGIIALATQGKGGRGELEQAIQVLQKVQDPDFDMRELTAPELRVFANYFPEQYQAYIPPEVKQVVESPELRLTQLRSLRRLEDISREGLPLEERLAGQEAGRRIAAEAGRANEAAIADVAARGRLGTSDELSARLQANQAQSELERGLGADLARTGIERRTGALAGAANLAGSVRGQDIDVAAQNANIMNRFAELISNLKTQEARENAAARERAAFANVGTTQRVGESNALARYQAALENLNRRNELKSNLAGFRLNKAQAVAGALGNLGQAKYGEQAARNQTIQNIGTGFGQAVGGAGDILGGTGALGGGVQGLYRRQPRYGYA